jgi:hypothetical protein
MLSAYGLSYIPEVRDKKLFLRFSKAWNIFTPANLWIPS